MENKKKSTVKKIVVRLLIALLVLLLALVGLVYALFHNELATLNTLTHVEDIDLFTMSYQGDYGFDDFLAQGGASSDAGVVDFVIRRLLKGIPVSFELPDLGCSTLAVANGEGGYLFGRNFDMYDSPALLLYTTPDNGYRSVSMVSLSYLGYSASSLPSGIPGSINTMVAAYAPLDGMNEKGLCIGVLLIDTDSTHQDNALPDITTTTAIRLILDKAATVDEALALLAQYDMHSSAGSCYHFAIADATGKSVVVEYIDDELSIVDSPYATNFLLTPGDYDFGGGHERFAVLEEAYAAHEGVMDADLLMDTLASVKQAPSADDPTRKSFTQWSCVYDPQNLTVTICYDMDYDTPRTFSLL